jgi:nicotinamide-nucleotide amidase
MKLPNDIATLAKDAIQALTAKGLTVSTAESCTGGLIAGALTSVSGSSEVVYGGTPTRPRSARSGYPTRCSSSTAPSQSRLP